MARAQARARQLHNLPQPANPQAAVSGAAAIINAGVNLPAAQPQQQQGGIPFQQQQPQFFPAQQQQQGRIPFQQQQPQFAQPAPPLPNLAAPQVGILPPVGRQAPAAPLPNLAVAQPQALPPVGPPTPARTREDILDDIYDELQPLNVGNCPLETYLIYEQLHKGEEISFYTPQTVISVDHKVGGVALFCPAERKLRRMHRGHIQGDYQLPYGSSLYTPPRL